MVVLGMKDLPYEDGPVKLNLLSPEQRRERRDLILLYK